MLAVDQILKVQLSKAQFALFTLNAFPSDGNPVRDFKPTISIYITEAHGPCFEKSALGPW